MPVIFAFNAGKVIAIEDNVAAGSLSMVSLGAPITYATHKTIISRVGVSVAGNYQFLHTIGQDVYLYVFGDRMGQIVLHGTCFEKHCAYDFLQKGTPAISAARAAAPAAKRHGFEELYQWYLQNRIAANPTPITVTIGRGTTFKGFVTGLTGDAQDAIFRTISFQLTLATLPYKQWIPAMTSES